MKREEILRQLKSQQARLTQLNVRSLAVFGSVARDEARPDSDIDILVEFDGPTTFDRYMDVKQFLEDVLGCRVDLLTRRGVRPELMSLIEREAVHVS